jgi:hypothetical protein
MTLPFVALHESPVFGHETDMPKSLGDVRCWVNSGKHLLSLSFSGFDPEQITRGASKTSD